MRYVRQYSFVYHFHKIFLFHSYICVPLSFPDVKEQETSAVDYTAGDMIFFYCDSPCLQGSICSRRES
ncbi:unnamed protein product [Brassica oleracea var. botrytis]